MAKIIVLGGGVAGLVAAKLLSPFHKVTLLEETNSLGGVGGTLSCKAGADCTVCTACTLPELTQEVLSHDNVTVRTGVDLTKEDLDADAVIVATGLEVADGTDLLEYGADRYDSVITALELDRLLRQEGEGPLGKRVLDIPGEDGRVAIIQCVCSRDTGQLPYCSRVCCAYSARLALEVRERYPGATVDVFYMDIQREDDVASAQIDVAMANKGVEYIRSRPAAVQEVPGGRMEVLYEDTLDGEIHTRDYDMVVLSTGLVPSKGTRYLAERLELMTDVHGFITSHPETATRTSAPTVFAAGGATGPVDLVEASMGAMAAAAEVLGLIPPDWPGYPPRVIVVGGGPAAEGADSAVRAAGAAVSMVLGAPGKGLQRLEGEPLGFLARMGSPGSDAIFKLKGDIVIIVPDRGGAFYEPVPDEAGTVAILMSEGPEALLLASDLMESRPGVQVHVLFREMQVATMGMQELQLDLASRGAGFHRYKAGSLNVGRGDGDELVVRFVDELSPEMDEMALVVQHVARPLVEHKEDLVWPWFLSRYAPLGVPPRHRLNVLPVLTPRRGVYTTTPATGTTTAATLGGPAAAAMALADYARGFTLMEEVAVVDPAKCAACLNCLRLCPHDAIVFDDEDRAARVMVRACLDCGMCRGICPAEAIEMVPRDELEVD